jgi:hypothetical protein
MAGPTSVGYNFNALAEIRSHSAILYNERMAILFYMLDLESINLNSEYAPHSILKVRALLKQIYKNVRMLMRQNPASRAILRLETEHSGMYTTDLQLGMIDRMIEFCEMNGYTIKYMHIIVNELNTFEMVLKDFLQFFSYFIRPDFRQKPDIELATERYKEMADRKTVEDLRLVIGRRHNIDFDNLGSKRVDIDTAAGKQEALEYGDLGFSATQKMQKQIEAGEDPRGSAPIPMEHTAKENAEEDDDWYSDDEKHRMD